MGTLFDHNGRPFSTKLREWSLITGRGGGYKKGGGGYKKAGGQLKFYPYKKGSEKVLAMLKGGDTNSFEVV